MQSRRVTIDDFNMNIMDIVKVLFDEVDEPNVSKHAAKLKRLIYAGIFCLEKEHVTKKM